MKGAIGNTMVMNIVITFVVLTTAFLIGSIAYSKAYKVKTKIIDIIEKYGDEKGINNSEAALKEITTFLGESGYRTASVRNCNKYIENPDKEKSVLTTAGYDICVIEKNSDSTTYHGRYYKVVVFMYFDFPIIGDMIKIPVTGETQSFLKPVS